MIAYNPDTGEIAQVPDDDSHMIEVSSEPPSDWRETDYLYDPETDTYSEAPPNPHVAYDEIEQLLIDAYTSAGSSDPELDAMKLINSNPVVVKALERENYGRVVKFTETEIKPNESVVDDQFISDLKDVLKV